MENGYRKSQDGLANKVSVKVERVGVAFPKIVNVFCAISAN